MLETCNADPRNFHFENDSITFFDFDIVGYGWLVNDIMTFWQHLELNVYTGRMINSILIAILHR
ncbi:hypothetical protein [uncultured Chitinophaga sp.]|jgi:Putative homoserine kinase type II (protein kinase fold)|uniref:hypothetical protein n=1 Tax=uncultured Chitinophaga sp. TaxID=339340 RepID=UPI002638450E|nr:hypothetical protein [uncultured Chitinophaga sp.]